MRRCRRDLVSSSYHTSVDKKNGRLMEMKLAIFPIETRMGVEHLHHRRRRARVPPSLGGRGVG